MGIVSGFLRKVDRIAVETLGEARGRPVTCDMLTKEHEGYFIATLQDVLQHGDSRIFQNEDVLVATKR